MANCVFLGGAESQRGSETEPIVFRIETHRITHREMGCREWAVFAKIWQIMPIGVTSISV